MRADGSPSGTLLRRTLGAFELAKINPNAVFLATGAVGRYPPSEAAVMRQILEDNGVSAKAIILDEESTDTLSSAYNCAQIIRKNGQLSPVVVCSSPYHNFRCTTLLRLLGIDARQGIMPPDRPHLGWRKWAWYCLREIPATVWDVFLVLVQGRRKPSTGV